ncbi:MAG: hypothetical protein P3X22_000140 [Thermoprotei archaeon]|nr:hypothetical protein [Thermoprotei archaeon]
MVVVDIVKRIVSGMPRGVKPRVFPDDGVDFDDIVARLHMAKMEVDSLKEHLVRDIEGHYDSMLSAARRGDSESLELMAAEVVLKRKILASVITYSKLLALAIQRINDARNIETLVKVLTPLEYVMRAAGDYLTAVSPETAARLNSVIEATERVIRSTDITASYIPAARLDLDPEVRQEIARVVAEANRESEMLTSNRVKTVSLEDRLLEHIKSRGAVINVGKAAKELNATPEEVREALKSLEAKGLIKLYRREAEASTS